MSRYMMRLSYRGAPFHGWQRQPGDVSVQEVLERSLSRLLGVDTAITGAGRTDAGVNARMMVAHFDSVSPRLDDPDSVVRALNSMVGRDIAVEWIGRVHDDAHARFDAVSRTYHYYTHGSKSPFLYPLSWPEPPRGLDFDRMNEAAAMLCGVDDFTSFSKLHTDVKTNICHVTCAQWLNVGGDGHRHVFVITADRFLRNMVRAVVGTLIDVGRGKLLINDFRDIIAARDRCAAGTSMPAHALFLWEVVYPYAVGPVMCQ